MEEEGGEGFVVVAGGGWAAPVSRSPTPSVASEDAVLVERDTNSRSGSESRPPSLKPSPRASPLSSASSSFADVTAAALPPAAHAPPSPPPPPPPRRRVEEEEEVSCTLFGKLERVLRLYEGDLMFEAARMLDALEADMERLLRGGGGEGGEEGGGGSGGGGGTPPSGVAARVRHVRHALRETGRGEEIRGKCADVRVILEQLRRSDGWRQARHADGISTAFRREESESSAVHSIRVDGSVPVNAADLLAIMHERDLLSRVVPADLEVRQLCRPSRLRQALYTRLRLPWPFSDRDAALDAHAVDLLAEGRVVVVGRSTAAAAALAPPVPAGARRLDVRLFGCVLRPVGPRETRVTAVMNLDLRANALPDGLLNFFSRQLAFQGFEKFRSAAAGLEPPRSERYAELRERVAECLRQQRRRARPPLPPGPRPPRRADGAVVVPNPLAGGGGGGGGGGAGDDGYAVIDQRLLRLAQIRTAEREEQEATSYQAPALRPYFSEPPPPENDENDERGGGVVHHV